MWKTKRVGLCALGITTLCLVLACGGGGGAGDGTGGIGDGGDSGDGGGDGGGGGDDPGGGPAPAVDKLAVGMYWTYNWQHRDIHNTFPGPDNGKTGTVKIKLSSTAQVDVPGHGTKTVYRLKFSWIHDLNCTTVNNVTRCPMFPFPYSGFGSTYGTGERWHFMAWYDDEIYMGFYTQGGGTYTELVCDFNASSHDGRGFSKTLNWQDSSCSWSKCSSVDLVSTKTFTAPGNAVTYPNCYNVHEVYLDKNCENLGSGTVCQGEPYDLESRFTDEYFHRDYGLVGWSIDQAMAFSNPSAVYENDVDLWLTDHGIE